MLLKGVVIILGVACAAISFAHESENWVFPDISEAQVTDELRELYLRRSLYVHHDLSPHIRNLKTLTEQARQEPQNRSQIGRLAFDELIQVYRYCLDAKRGVRDYAKASLQAHKEFVPVYGFLGLAEGLTLSSNVLSRLSSRKDKEFTSMSLSQYVIDYGKHLGTSVKVANGEIDNKARLNAARREFFKVLDGFSNQGIDLDLLGFNDAEAMQKLSKRLFAEKQVRRGFVAQQCAAYLLR